MPRPILVITILVLMILIVGTPGLCASGWQWPSEMTIGGFKITAISGGTRPDGSGSAVGTLHMPGDGDERVSLTRASNGEISGNVSVDSSLSGAQVEGAFSLNGSGLKGRGVLKWPSRSVADASISIDSTGKFNASAPSHSLFDTTLATYKFEGSVSVQGGGGAVAVTASGSVRRTGKLAGQVTEYPISNVSVSAADGRGSVEVGGVSVTFTFF